MRDLVVVILAGGAGTRFWPLSTEQRPKQFLDLFGGRTLLQRSLDRVRGMVPPERVLVLTNEAFLSQVREQLPELPEENVVGEPARRDTAAAVALSALLCRRLFGDPVILTLTADHLIEPVELFQKAALSAIDAAAREGVLYTFGIRPSYPATSYGYLELGRKVDEDEGIEHYEVLRFKEKPDLQTAKGYLREGRYLWNSGMFVWQTGVILEELKEHLPRHLDHLEGALRHLGTPRWRQALRDAFEPLEAISIDYGVMEKASRVRCVAAPFRWSDVGGWLALQEFLPRDAAGNAYRGKLQTLEAEGNLVFCDDDDEVVALVGVKDLVVVRAGKTTLVVPKERAEEVKRLVQRLKGRG